VYREPHNKTDKKIQSETDELIIVNDELMRQTWVDEINQFNLSSSAM
jgi:hypothetical protein